MISKALFMSLANVGILTSMGKIQDVLQILQYIKPIADPVVFLNID